MNKNITPPSPYILKAHVTHLHESLRHFFQPELKGYLEETYGETTMYLCPLCLKSVLLIANGNLYATGQFSEDHYPPESVGGCQTVLVCKACNDKAGHEYEYILKEELNSRSYNKGISNAKLKVRAQIKGVQTAPLKMKFFKEEENVILFDFGNNVKNPKIARWLESIENNGESFEVTVTVSGNNQDLIARSLLKAAYLYCFGLWGYEFCFSENGDKIRQVLAGSLKYPFSNGCLYWEEENLERLPHGVCYISSPADYRGYVVNVPMLLEETGYKCIVGIPIPNPAGSGWSDLEALAQRVLHSDQEITINPIPHYNIRELITGYSSIWALIEKGVPVIVPR